jgi:hypothetical protein
MANPGCVIVIADITNRSSCRMTGFPEVCGGPKQKGSRRSFRFASG